MGKCHEFNGPIAPWHCPVVRVQVASAPWMASTFRFVHETWDQPTLHGVYGVSVESYYLCKPDSSIVWGVYGMCGRGSTFVNPTAASLGVYMVSRER